MSEPSVSPDEPTSLNKAAEVVNTLWPKGNESWKEVGQYFFVVTALSAL
ncbi:hypothetical protein VCRA2110O1_430002 [Vibrio crassostreae]|nr:hypothetical protein [Vibrio crassostreae]CAK2024257.1 hypothetical protein VCRA2114E5_390002 [Vibrio crassostreae]CAK2062156.1 hypothetical protein VCRA2110O4_460004 [Vibrio crassostreae]CAK2066927.1 hypothetical protein VCRA2110O1_430002 [Vibrio crassostreae]CAK2846439.1 hypothetical protein VCRA2110O3_430002 [Vibrio crassostreae]CAK2885525.1 hypothetical protein VCRA2110O2_450002 [Vibrio crassostreae]